jgi:hypothetical protein
MCSALRGGTKINDVKHQGFAAAVLLGQKSCELVRGAQLGPGKSSRNLARGKRDDFKLDQPGYPCFHLLRTVRQGGGHNRHASRGIAQYVALGDVGYKLKLIHFVRFTVPN